MERMENSGTGSVESDPCAQKAEIVALTKAMEISTDQVINIFIDSIYAYGQVVQKWIPRNLTQNTDKLDYSKILFSKRLL